MKKINYLFFLFLFVSSFSNLSLAQQLTLSNDYVIDKFSLSPAFAGTGGNFEVFGSYRRDWMGIQGAPETKIIAANGIIHKNMGLGGSVSSLQAGIFTNLSAHLFYAYHARIAGENFISFGLGMGILENHLDLSSAGAQADPVVNTMDRTTTMFDASFGIAYHNKKFNIGVAAPRLLASKEDANKLYFLSPHYLAHIGYKIELNNSWTIDPTVVVSLPSNAPLSYEVAVPIVYHDKIWIAPIYKKSSIAICLGTKLFSSFIMHYSYEFSSKGIAGQSSGTHEITIGWILSKKNSDLPEPDSKKPYYDWINK